MKKISYFLIPLLIVISISSCAGYKPIFSTTDIKFRIADYSINGEKNLAKKIYLKLYSLSKSSENSPDAKNISFSINVQKKKTEITKDSTGKVTAYNITLTTEIVARDTVEGNNILNKIITYSSSYKVQDQYSETLKLENKTIENLSDKTYQDILINLSDNIS